MTRRRRPQPVPIPQERRRGRINAFAQHVRALMRARQRRPR